MMTISFHPAVWMCLSVLLWVAENAAAKEPLPRIYPLHAAPLSNFGLTSSYVGTPVASSQSTPIVIDSVQVQGVYLGSAFATADNSPTVTALEEYLAYLTGSSFLTALSPYGVGPGSVTAGQVLNVTLPHYSAGNPQYVQDAGIQEYLTAKFANGTLMLPTDKTVHVVYTEPGVAVQAGLLNTSINSFLGYHGQGVYQDAMGNSQKFAYIVVPYPGDPNPTIVSQGFDALLDELTAVTSHELAEAATDPFDGAGWLETVLQTYEFQFGSLKLKLFTRKLRGEEIGDVPLLIYNYSPLCYARLNGYLIQKQIAPDGQSLLTPDGATDISSVQTTTTTSSTRTLRQRLLRRSAR